MKASKLTPDTVPLPAWVRLERKRNEVDGTSEVIGWYSPAGSPGPDDWTELARGTVDLPGGPILAGIAASGADTGTLAFSPLRVAVCLGTPPSHEGRFVRGDGDGSGAIDLTDAVVTLGFLFLGNPTSLDCPDAADANDSGDLNVTDAVVILGFLFLGNPAVLPSPNPLCGLDSSDPKPCVHTCEGR